MKNQIFLRELETCVRLKMVSIHFRILENWLLPCREDERISGKDGQTWLLVLDWEPTRYAELPVTSGCIFVGVIGAVTVIHRRQNLVKSLERSELTI
jgi:hypothetical protein